MDPDAARERLFAEQTRVSGLMKELRSDLGLEADAASAELADYDQHPADAGSDTFEREKDLGILEELENELAELQAALERIDNGTYGIDEVTGEPIDPARLEAFPSARRNVERGGR
jgi:RNA polymerase-binding transcription factor DksA